MMQGISPVIHLFMLERHDMLWAVRLHEPVGNLLLTALVKLLLQQLVCPRVQSPTEGAGIYEPSYAIQIKALPALPEVGEPGPTDLELFGLTWCVDRRRLLTQTRGVNVLAL